jgi:hypothetical protein
MISLFTFNNTSGNLFLISIDNIKDKNVPIKIIYLDKVIWIKHKTVYGP